MTFLILNKFNHIKIVKNLIIVSLGLALILNLLLAEKIEARNVAAQIKNPKVVAQKLYQAWRLKNRKGMSKFAASKAVEKLFSVRWRKMQFKGCENRQEGGFECIYLDNKNDLSLAMIIEGGVSAGGYHVESVSFSSED